MQDPAPNQEIGFQVPTYAISYASDGTLQFDPPPDSPELAIALSIHFPFERTLKEKMREAQLDFLRSKHQLQVPAPIATGSQPEARPKIPIATPSQMAIEEDASNFFVPQAKAHSRLLDSTMQQPTSAPQPANHPKSKKRPRKSSAKRVTQAKNLSSQNQHVWNLNSGESTPKKSRRTLGAEEAVQVFANRGNVCDYHKAHRTKCDPAKCPRNKLFQQPSEASDALFEDSPGGTSNCHWKECNIIASHSHAPEFNPPVPEGNHGMIEMGASNAIPTSLSSQNPNPLSQNERPSDGQGEGNWSMPDAMLLRSPLDGSEFGQGLHGATPGGAYPFWCRRCRFFHEVDSNQVPCELVEFDSAFEMSAAVERGGRPRIVPSSIGPVEKEKKKKKKDEDDARNNFYGGPGDDNGGGGSNNKYGDGKDGDGSGDGGAAGGTSGSGSIGSSYDPFWGFNGDGDGWYSSMVVAFMLAWLALRNSTRNSWARLPSWRIATGYSPDENLASSGISIIEFGCLNSYLSFGSQEENDDGPSGGGSHVGDADQNSQLNTVYPVVITNLVQGPPNAPGGLKDTPLGELKAPEGFLPRSDPLHLSTAPSTILATLSRLHTKSQTKTNAKHSSKSMYASSTITRQHDLQSLENSSLAPFRCFSSTIRAF